MTGTLAPPALVAADGLRRILAAVGPFAATTDRTELLESVHLRCHNGHLIATATDRRIVAEARTPLRGEPLPPVLLHTSDAQRLGRLLVDLDELPVALRLEQPSGLTVDVARDHIHIGTWDHRAAEAYPDMRAVLAGEARYYPPLPDGAFRIDRPVLERFAHIAAGEDFLIVAGPSRPTLFRFGATFRAAVMATNTEGTAQ